MPAVLCPSPVDTQPTASKAAPKIDKRNLVFIGRQSNTSVSRVKHGMVLRCSCTLAAGIPQNTIAKGRSQPASEDWGRQRHVSKVIFYLRDRGEAEKKRGTGARPSPSLQSASCEFCAMRELFKSFRRLPHNRQFSSTISLTSKVVCVTVH